MILGGVSFFFALSVSIFLYSFISDTSAQKVAAAALVKTGGPATAYAAASSAPVLEIHIANNGLTLVRDATITDIHGSTLLVSSKWGSQEFKWIVLTDASTFENRTFGTRFWTKDNQPMSLGNLRVGDRITVTGMLVTSAIDPTIDATAVRSSE